METPLEPNPSLNPAEANPASAGGPSLPLSPLTPQTDLNIIAQQEANIPLWKDFGYFLLQNKKWWLLPIIVILLLLGLLMALSSTSIAPFIYTVF